MERRTGTAARLTLGAGLMAAVVGAVVTMAPLGAQQRGSLGYPIVDTAQGTCYDDERPAACPDPGAAFSGQDAQYRGRRPSYVDNGDGTVFDVNTGLTWQQTPGPKATHEQAVREAAALRLADHSDWRLPTIKELYSLILFDGTDVSPCTSGRGCSAVPFVDAAYFDFEYGDTSAGERVIDAQYWSSTMYVGTTMGSAPTAFGVNFADGRIKGYLRTTGPNGQPFKAFVRYVRGNPDYGVNLFVNNGNGTITDRATGLQWAAQDSGRGMKWQHALAYCEALTTGGYDDWRLPDAKELQSLVDYRRGPSAGDAAAIDPAFRVTPIVNEAGQPDAPSYWTSTTHAAPDGTGALGVYVAFGRAMGYMNGAWIDVHGAGAQRSDPKSGDPSQWPTGHGPQGDAVRIDNYARCVRAGGVVPQPAGGPAPTRPRVDLRPGGSSPNPTPLPEGGGTPPPEALRACQGSRPGAACSFIAPLGTVFGTCTAVGAQLACVPNTPPPPRRD